MLRKLNDVFFRTYLNQKLSPGEEYLLNFGIEKMIEKDYIFKSQILENWMDCGTPKLIINSNSKMLTLLTPEPVGYKKEGSVEVIEPVFMGKNITISNSTIGPGVTINDNVKIKKRKFKTRNKLSKPCWAHEMDRPAD